MRSNIRGILVFLLAFLIGTAPVIPPLPDIYEIPELSGPFPKGETVSCRMKPLPKPERDASTSFTIEIRRRDADFEVKERVIPADITGSTNTNIDLELGESIERQLIVLHSPAKQTFKVEMQYENSMALGDEGPHFDLVDWRHHTSPWKLIKPSGKNTYLVPEITEAEFTRFPKVTTSEIVSALRKTGAEKRWLTLARTCAGPNSGPCYVSTSRISIRISVKQYTTWKLAHTLNFSIPMGC